MKNTALTIILACVAYVTADVVNTSMPSRRAITFDRDHDTSSKPFVIPLQQVSDEFDIAATIGDPGCTCNCNGKCMEAIDELRAEVAALRAKCENCQGCQAPRPLQSALTVGGKTVTIRGNTYDLKSYLAQHGDGVQYGVSGMTIDEHLGHHGVENASHLTTKEKHDLHSALHHAGVEANGNFVVRQASPKVQTTTTRRSYPTYSSGGCANGRCNQPQRRFRLFR